MPKNQDFNHDVLACIAIAFGEDGEPIGVGDVVRHLYTPGSIQLRAEIGRAFKELAQEGLIEVENHSYPCVVWKVVPTDKGFDLLESLEEPEPSTMVVNP